VYPGRITNNNLLENKKLKDNFKENVDYFLISDLMWYMFTELHGGGPPVSFNYEEPV
jgi:hypothetical protein